MQAGLPDDGLKSTYSDLIVVWNWHGYGGVMKLLLHCDMTAFPSYLNKPMLHQNCANLFS